MCKICGRPRCHIMKKNIFFKISTVFFFSIKKIELAQKIRGIGVHVNISDRGRPITQQQRRQQQRKTETRIKQTNVIRQNSCDPLIRVRFCFSIFYFNTCACAWNGLFIISKSNEYIASIILSLLLSILGKQKQNKQKKTKRPNEKQRKIK